MQAETGLGLVGVDDLGGTVGGGGKTAAVSGELDGLPGGGGEALGGGGAENHILVNADNGNELTVRTGGGALCHGEIERSICAGGGGVFKMEI